MAVHGADARRPRSNERQAAAARHRSVRSTATHHQRQAASAVRGARCCARRSARSSMRDRPTACGRRRTRRSICWPTSSSRRWPRSAARHACCSPTRSASARRSRPGLLLSELRERGWIERALIVCPAGLRDTWARELRDSIRHRRGHPRSGGDRRAGRVAAAGRESVGRPCASRSRRSISSSAPKCWRRSSDEPLDLLIADEAHHLTPGHRSRRRRVALASRATVVRAALGDAALGRRGRVRLPAEHRRARRSDSRSSAAAGVDVGLADRGARMCWR